MLAYFDELSGKYKPTSLWAFHSMLKSTIRANENIDIAAFFQVSAFLKTKFSGYKVVKAMVFEEEQIGKFITEADDLRWLDVKVVLIFGICGACRTDELVRITVDDVERHGGLFLVKLHTTKNKTHGSFTINGGFASIVAKYMALRSSRLKSSDRFFTNYQRGKCTIQFIGKQKFALMPRRIAEYLSLPDVDRYTGHAFRRTSATILANNGADLETIMRHGRWRNAACAKGYIDDSLKFKERTGAIFQRSVLGIDHSPPTFWGQNDVSSTVTSVAPIIPFTVASDGQSSTSSAVSITDCATFYDTSIDDADLVDVTERVSQAFEEKRLHETNKFASNESGGSDSDAGVNGGQSLANFTQSNNNSILNAVLGRSFQSVNFDRLSNCTFNFHLAKTDQ